MGTDGGNHAFDGDVPVACVGPRLSALIMAEYLVRFAWLAGSVSAHALRHEDWEDCKEGVHGRLPFISFVVNLFGEWLNPWAPSS